MPQGERTVAVVMIEEPPEEGTEEERTEWRLVPVVSHGGHELVQASRSAKRVFVGAGARALFYPTLLYNVVRNKLQSEFRWWDQIDQFLLLGAVPFPGDVLRLKAVGVRAVVTLNESYETLVPTAMYQNLGIDHLVIPTRDYLFAPSVGDIRRAVAFIHSHARSGQTTYVHCKAGRGRSTTVVLCYLVEHRGMTPAEAFQYVRIRRPRVLLATAQWQAVREYSKQVRSGFGYKMPLAWHPRPIPFADGGMSSSAVSDAVSEAPPVGANEVGSSEIEDLPVVISGVDLTGYRGIEDAGLVGNDLWQELGLVYRVRFMAARSVVNAVGVARASVEWARVSCLVIGCQAEGDRVLGSSSRLTVDNFHSSEGMPQSKPTSIADQMSIVRHNLPLSIRYGQRVSHSFCFGADNCTACI